MDKEKPVIIDIGSNCREFRRTIKMTPEEMELFNEELRHIGRIYFGSQNQKEKIPV